MLTTVNLLDAARRAQSIRDQRPCSDYRLCKMLGLSDSAISNYRKGRSHPDDQVTAGLAEIAGLDVHETLAWIQAERSRDTASKNRWMEVAERLAANSPPPPTDRRIPPPEGGGPIVFRDLGALLRSGLNLLRGGALYIM